MWVLQETGAVWSRDAVLPVVVAVPAGKVAVLLGVAPAATIWVCFSTAAHFPHDCAAGGSAPNINTHIIPQRDIVKVLTLTTSLGFRSFSGILA
jgi:hypothetical protein